MKVQVLIRIEPETALELKKQAEKENRTVTNLVETVIKKYLEEEKKKK